MKRVPELVSPALVVIAKAPVAGRSKTRLCPPCSPQQAAELAEAALADTLLAVLATPQVSRRVLVLEGEPGPWLPDGFEVIAQRGHGLDERLAGAFDDVASAAFLVGMDTPQLTPALLTSGLDALRRDERAVLGPARDGGYWGIGLQRPDAAAFLGVPMSEQGTAEAQRRRLHELGMTPHELPVLRDVDLIADATEVARLAPHSRFAAAYQALGSTLELVA